MCCCPEKLQIATHYDRCVYSSGAFMNDKRLQPHYVDALSRNHGLNGTQLRYVY